MSARTIRTEAPATDNSKVKVDGQIVELAVYRQIMAEGMHRPKVAEHIAWELGVTGLGRRYWQKVRRKQRKRRDRREKGVDPLATSTIHERLGDARARRRWEAGAAERAAEEAARKAQFERELREWERETARRKAVHKDLLRAARVARGMGYRVSKSTDRHGRVSSYYVEEYWGSGERLRISDHDIPSTIQRESNAAFHGHARFDGSADIYASDSPLRRPEWWRRAFLLAFNGRDVPGWR